MKTNKKRPSIKIKVSVFLLLIALAGFFVAYITNVKKGNDNNNDNVSNSMNTTNYSEPTELDKAESSRNKNSVIESMNTPVDEKKSPSEPISVTITRSSRTNVGVYIEKLAEGKCNLSIIQNGIEKIAMNAKIITQSDYSTCEGFFIDSSRLENTPFTIIVKVSSGDRNGSANQEVQ